MKKTLTFLFSMLVFTSVSFGQLEDRFNYFGENEIKGYVQPFVNSVSVALNTGMYHSASVADYFGFSLGFQGMYIMVPDDQMTYTLTAPDGQQLTTATLFGKDGGYVSGTNGYLTYPGGLDISSLPMAVPQVAFSTFGTELMIRYFPKIDLGEAEFGYWGVGVKHNVSRYLPTVPLDLAAQVFYSKLEVTDLMSSKNLSINLIASKTFAIVTAYGGIQIESSSMDLTYTYTNPDIPAAVPQDISLSVDGENSFRFTAGAALSLGFFVLNVDYSIGNQSVVNGGFSFEF